MPFVHVWDSALTFEVIIAGIVLAVVVLTTAFAVFRYRAKTRREASQNTEHKPVEIAYALGLLGIAIAIVVVTRGFNSNDGLRNDAQTMRPASGGAHITVTGFQWCWRFDYPQAHKTVQGNCNDGRMPTMVVPIGEPITVTTTATDVIHSWWVPALRYKLDAFPYHKNTVTFRFTRSGRWLGHCAEFCGERHAYMTFWLKAVPKQQYQQWLSAQHAAGTA